LGVLARVPLASGFLSGKYRPGATFTDQDDIRSRQNQADIQARLKLVQEIQQNEVPAGIAMAPWALAWCLQHPAVTCVIPGCKTVEQLEINASAADLELVRADHPQALPSMSF
jgi:aryl-alcohol dehydrogenase-like predicted oxidoreductase